MPEASRRPPRLSPALCLAAAGGVAALQMLPQLPPLLPLLAAAAVAAVAAWRWRRARFSLLLLAVALLAAAYAGWRAQQRLMPALPPQLVWQDITIEGIVEDFPDVDERRTRFDFQVKRIVAPVARELSFKVRLNAYHRDAAPDADIASGNRLRLVARLRPPVGTANPHGFDYAGYLLAKNIRLVGYVRQPQQLTLIADGGISLRRRLHERIGGSGAAQPALLNALVIGNRSLLTSEQWEVLRHTGTAHLMSVSGVHIGLIFLVAVVLFGHLWRRLPRLTAWLPAQAAALLLALPAALAYAMLTGFAVPVQRSFFMMAAAGSALLIGGYQSGFAALCLALALVVGMDPWAVLTPGFWLSFLLTAAIILLALSGTASRAKWRQLVAIQLLLSVIAIPLTLWFFNEASFISPLANLIAVPLVGFAILPLALAGTVAGDWCWHVAGALLDLLWGCLQWLDTLPYASIAPAAPPLWLFLLAVAGSVWLLLPRGVPYRFAGALPIAAMLLWTPPPPADGTVRMNVLDVGQGTAVVLQTRRHAVVYDTGRAFGGHIVASYLRGIGVGKIDRLVISHDDYDHRGGMKTLLQRIAADTVIASDGDIACRQPQQWEYDGVTFTVLHPSSEPMGSENDRSCVLRVENAAGKSALLTGDISTAVEDRIAQPADILLVAHHGSRHSSGGDFLRAVSPSIAVIPVGRNDYGHPHGAVLDRLQSVGAALYRTDADGAVLINIADRITVRRWRDIRRRYWQRAANPPKRADSDA